MAALHADPDDDATRLVLADWLADHGDEETAAFIRLQLEYAALDEDDRSEQARVISTRHSDAVTKHKATICAALGVPASHESAVECEFRGGFLDSLFVPVQWLLYGAANLEPHALLLRRLAVARVNGHGHGLARCPLLRSVTDLDVRAWVSTDDAEEIARSPHLGRLRSLQIWLGNRWGYDEVTLSAFARGATKAYPDLEELRIIDVPGCTAETVARANELIGRPIASAVLPSPRLFPIAADFSEGLFAGRLPDGTQVLVDVRADPVRMFCFTPEGDQTDIRELAEYDGAKHDDEVKEYLAEAMGFEPGLIRVRELDDPTSSYFLDAGYDDNCGLPDDPAVRPQDDVYAQGFAQESSYWLEYGAYVFACGNYWYVGPDGTVEST